MATYDEESADCIVQVHKEGALSALGHDLDLRVGRFSVEVADGSRVRASFDVDSIRVVTATRAGEPIDALSANDREKIEALIRNDILEASRFSEVVFESSEVGTSEFGRVVRGRLTLHGVTRPVEARSRIQGEVETFRTRIHQPGFGIKPYRAMLGALRVQADVFVLLSVPVTR